MDPALKAESYVVSNIFAKVPDTIPEDYVNNNLSPYRPLHKGFQQNF